VVDSDGEPIEGADVSLGNGETVTTDADGDYEFTDVSVGDQTLEVSAEGFESATQSVTVKTDETTNQDFQLEAKRYSIVLDSDPIAVDLDGAGEYEAGQEITISAPETLDGYEFEGWYTTDGNLYELDRKHTIERIERDYDLVARYDEREQANLEISGITTPREIQSGESVEIHVEVSNTGQRDTERTGLKLTVGEKRFERTVALVEGGSESYTFEWMATADATAVIAEVDPENSITESKETDNRISHTIEVKRTETDTPTDSNGSVVISVPNSELSRVEEYKAIVWVDGDPIEKQLGSDGQATFEEVPAGEHFVAVESENDEFEERARRVIEAGTETTVEVDVPELLQVNGQVQTKGGEPVEGVAVKINGRTTTTDEQGRYTFASRFQPDHYVATVYESESQETKLWQHTVTFESDDTDRNIVLPLTESDLERQDPVTAGVDSIPEEFVTGLLLGNTGVKYNFPGARTEGYAFTSGFKYGVAGKLVEEGESLADLLETDPMKTIDALVRLGNAFLDRPIGTSAELGEATVEGVEDDAWNVPADDRRAMNPYDDGDLRSTFQVGYDSGYRSMAISLYVIPISKISKGSKVSKGLTKLKVDKFSKSLSKVSPDVRGKIRGKVRYYTGKSDVDVSTYLSETGDNGARLLIRVDQQAGTHILRKYESDEIDSNHILRINTRFENGDLDQGDLSRTFRLLNDDDMGQEDLERMLGILETKHSDPYTGDNIDGDELLDVAENNGDLSETKWVIQKQEDTPGLNNDVVWLEKGVPGDDGTGWKHIVDKHSGDLKNQYDSINTDEDVQNLIRDTIKDPDEVLTTDDGKAVFKAEVEGDKKPVTVYVGS
jgi:hypothetical protein